MVEKRSVNGGQAQNPMASISTATSFSDTTSADCAIVQEEFFLIVEQKEIHGQATAANSAC